ncbi:hypothetical protein PP459_gp069 [Streptomyces phage Wakanda]|uniref:Uncharacterized protein n=1 Tax=Streptomyces phage Wakanda TaxID=2713267 RepID=A0A6G8R1V4_9CAUD|nr:hypothetical protein PP459_gp069 [Streptomyces phage Wakanda]QIN94164.1 hypothetical protein SEA_WAKANDA_203 [Streptomyces phage Wakanda]
MAYTVEQVRDAIRQWAAAGTDGGWPYDEGDFYDEIMWAGKDKAVRLDALNEDAFHVDRVGGSEGEGDHMAVVFRIGDQLFEKTGYYNSWDSNDWEPDYYLEEVEPYEVTVTRYRAKK